LIDFVRHTLKPLGYIRYGDDFVIFSKSREDAEKAREAGKIYLDQQLHLSMNPKNDIILKPKKGLHFLGHKIYPNSPISVDNYMMKKIDSNLNSRNIASYKALYIPERKKKTVDWHFVDFDL